MKKILLLSDTHIGSTVGLWPPDYKSKSGHDLPQSKWQQWLWASWGMMQDWAEGLVSEDDELTLVFNGDVIEGQHHRTVEIMSANIEDQFDAAATVLKGLVLRLEPKQIFFTNGTECHTRGAEKSLGNRLGAVKDPETGQGAFDYLKLDVDGCVTSFAHHCSCSTRRHLQATQHSVMISDENQRAMDAGHTPARVVCRAHRHEHGIWNNGDRMSIVTGPWQGLTRHGHKAVTGAVCSPSAVMLCYDGGKLPQSEFIKFAPKETSTKPIKI